MLLVLNVLEILTAGLLIIFGRVKEYDVIIFFEIFFVNSSRGSIKVVKSHKGKIIPGQAFRRY